MDLLARTGVGRDINRHYYSRDEVERELKRPVVQELLGLIRLRNTHPAFAGRFELEATTGNMLSLKWSNGEQFVRLSVDFVDSSYDLKCSKGSESRLEAADRCHSI
jgi:sucrose phosphorylase